MGIDRWPLRRLRVRGPSMAPTLKDGDVLLVSFRRKATPGAIVLVRWPARPDQLSVKRAVERRGEQWFVVGDNQFGSTDSRDLGPADVLGVATFRLWPRPRRLS
ncbi:S26 family signal peptidase [Kutzneria kofuensis]|uniref:Nickel-type superoxide dismutase maturation protease n=1 Tax=Kutzneria kofuensis TaxID=103725 RepID=A0A7W9KJU0_9PSEU|nr:S26 family signal peptidase [Kutzneria kofuensis]MBB5893613.1 nickel-type superoxide dismutase maturation protease [Kutzneria kofuensis]